MLFLFFWYPYYANISMVVFLVFIIWTLYNFKILYSSLGIQVMFSFTFKLSVKTRTCPSSYNFVSTQLDWNSWNCCQSHQCPVWQSWDPQKTGCEAAGGTATLCSSIQSTQSSEQSSQSTETSAFILACCFLCCLWHN